MAGMVTYKSSTLNKTFLHVFNCLNFHELYNSDKACLSAKAGPAGRQGENTMRTSLTFLCLIFLSSAVWAETINLKEGRSVTGKIIQKSDSEVKVDVNGISMTYYVDEIKDIDGKPLVTPTPMATVAPKVPEIVATKIPILPAVPKEAPVNNPTDKKALILKFIDVFGTRAAMTRNFETMLSSLAQQRPEEAAKIKERFKIDEVIDRLIPLYDKYFTAEDLKFYIDFYSSEKGKKLIFNIGSVMKDSIQVGAGYLKEKFPELANEQ
jgi:hypothetical protein